MKPLARKMLVALLVLAFVYGGYAAFVRVPTRAAKTAVIVAGTNRDGSMYYRCVAEESSPGVCDPAASNRVLVDARDSLTFTVRTDDGRPHSHDFYLEGWPYLVPPAGIEMELEDPEQSGTFTAWKSGEYRFICELPGHEEAGMWGTLVVQDR